MRRVRTDVSHRIRRQSSIFAAWWFRGLLAAGLAVVVILLVGPWVAGWFGADLPRSLSPLLPWGTTAEPVRPAPSALAPRSAPEPAATWPPIAQLPARDAAAASGPTAGTSVPSNSTATSGKPRAAAGAGTAPATGGTPAPDPAAGKTKASPDGARVDGSGNAAGPLTKPPAVYWVQVGAFLDPRNADRLVERLKAEGHPATTTVFEQSRVAYRVLLAPPEGATDVPEEILERVRGLGLTVERTPTGPAVTGLVPLRQAVETSHTLRQQGVRVQLKQEVGSSTFRVVRVGSFATSREAAAALAALSARGLEGLVVLER